MLSSVLEGVDHKGHIVAITHVAAVPPIGINRRAIAKYLTEEIDLSRLQNYVILVVHNGDLGAVAQVVFDIVETHRLDVGISGADLVAITIKGLEELMEVIGEAQPRCDLIKPGLITVPIQLHIAGYNVAIIGNHI